MRTKKRTKKRRVQRGGRISILQNKIFDIVNKVMSSPTNVNFINKALELINDRISEVNQRINQYNEHNQWNIYYYYNANRENIDNGDNILLEKELLENAKEAFDNLKKEIYNPKPVEFQPATPMRSPRASRKSSSPSRKSSSPSRKSVGPPSSAESFSPQKALINASEERRAAFENARNVFKNK